MAVCSISEMMKQCNCGGQNMDTSCYGCLRTYYNQKYHDKLKRGYVVRFLEKILGRMAVRNTSNTQDDDDILPIITIKPVERNVDEDPGDLNLTVVQEGMNLNTQSWEEIWSYMLDEEPEPEEEEFFQYLLDHADELASAEKPYKGDNQLKDKHKMKTDVICCNMMWKQRKILLFTSESEKDYKMACHSNWETVFAMDGEEAAQKLIHILKGEN